MPVSRKPSLYAAIRPFCIASCLFLNAFLAVESNGYMQVDNEIRSEQINETFYVFYGGGGLGANVGMSVGADGILLIDAMTANTATKLYAAIREISDKPIKYVLNTHSDADHSGGNAFFADQGAVILSQENARYSTAFGNVYFKDELSLVFNGEEISASHVFAHSPDDVIIHFSTSNLIFMGDTFTNNWHPTFSTGGIAGQRAALDMALALADTASKVIPGHGEIAGRQMLLDFKRDCDAWINRVAELVAEGLTVDALATDALLHQIKDRFNRIGRANFVPPNRYRRFIERTLSADFVLPYPLTSSQKEAIEGRYQLVDGRNVHVYEEEGRLFAGEAGAYLVELVPVTERQFHMRGWLDDTLAFTVDGQGIVAGIQLLIDGEQVDGVRLQ